MRIDYPLQEQLPALRALWKEAFGDNDAYLDLFFDCVFSPDRCRCVTLEGQPAAALYWLDCRCDGRPMAYLYAVATGKKHRGQGLCRALLADTHSLLAELGYAGCILVPGEADLFEMYAGMGYQTATTIREFDCRAGEERAALREIGAEEYARLRRQYLKDGGVVQEGENLSFLAALARFYAGEDFLLCAAAEDGRLFAAELLGSADAAPGILTALGYPDGTFRTPGGEKPFAMYHPLSDAPAPRYFGFAFD